MSGECSVDEALDALTDGTAIDWRRVIDSAGDPGTRRTLESLHVLARVQELSGPAGSGAPARWGALEIVETIGSGAFGTVFRARDPALDLDVALKVLHTDAPGSTERILEEGRWLAKLRHPNIVRVHGVDERDGRVGLRMELVRGRSLAQIVREDGPFGPYEAMRTGVDVCRALAAVHAAGLVHRDVKAQNVVREDTGRIVLMDFGAGSEPAPAPPGGGPALAGTPLYLAPEVLEGGGASPAADVYAVGVLLFHLLTGEFPVSATDLEGVRRAHRRSEMRRLEDARPDLPRALYEVVDRALDALPAGRHESAEAMARALAAALVAGEARERRSREPMRGHLPVQLTRFVGRRGALEELGALVRDHHLITLTGAGGSGKTRLALELAHGLSSSYGDGVWFVPLAAIETDDDVPAAVAAALGIRGRKGASTTRTLAQALARKELLIILDDCEHVAEGVARLLLDLIPATSSVTVLATSRESLRVSGEMLYDVVPLSLPQRGARLTDPETDGATPGSIARSEAIELFVERARAVRHDFALDAGSAPHVAEICRRLDGLPLALELAAACVRSLPVADIVRRLDDRLDLLRDPRLPEPRHHRTLEASMAWSHDLLGDDERLAMAYLRTFAGGWTLSAAETVLAGEAGIAPDRVVDLLSSLISKSLVRLETVGSDARYEMLNTVRAFVATRTEAATRRRAEEAFVDWCVTTASETHQEIISSGVRHAMRRFASEHDNLVAGCRLCLALDRVEDALRLASYMGRYWLVSGRWSEGRRMYETLLAHRGAAPRTLMRAAALSWLGVFAQAHAEADVARPCFEECLAIRRELGDERGVAAALNHLGVVHYDAGDYGAARRAFGESLTRRRAIDERRGIAQALTNLGLCERAEGRLEPAHQRFEEALTIHREIANEWGVAKITAEIGYLRALGGDLAAARRLLGEAIERQDHLGPSIAFKCYLGQVRLWAGDIEAARRAFEAAVTDHRRTGESGAPPEALHGLGLVALAAGEPVAAARLLGRAAATRRVALEPRARAEAEAAETALRQALGDDAYETERHAGAHHDMPGGGGDPTGDAGRDTSP